MSTKNAVINKYIAAAIKKGVIVKSLVTTSFAALSISPIPIAATRAESLIRFILRYILVV